MFFLADLKPFGESTRCQLSCYCPVASGGKVFVSVVHFGLGKLLLLEWQSTVAFGSQQRNCTVPVELG